MTRRPLDGAPDVSSSWQDHKDRQPPSVEPGTDYRCAVGTPVHPIRAGRVIGLRVSNLGASGRAIMIDHGAGIFSRYLHLGSIACKVGDYVTEPEVIAYSGASANGSNDGVGPHLHLTFWSGQARTPTPGETPTQDFEASFTGGHPTGGGSAPFLPTGKGDDVIVSIKGKTGARRGGVFYITGGHATLLGRVDATHAAPDGSVQLVDEGQIAALYASVSGLD